LPHELIHVCFEPVHPDDVDIVANDSAAIIDPADFGRRAPGNMDDRKPGFPEEEPFKSASGELAVPPTICPQLLMPFARV